MKRGLRIAGGVLKGRRIETPPKSRATRPIIERVKESLFSILASRLSGASVLDLFSGTGAIGIEALSRGSAAVTFVEGDPQNVSLIQRNLETLDLTEKSTLVKGRLPRALSYVKGSYDLLFCDPPFETDLAEKVLADERITPLIHSDTLIIVRRDRREPLLDHPGYAVTRRHRVGDNELWFLTKV